MEPEVQKELLGFLWESGTMHLYGYKCMSVCRTGLERLIRDRLDFFRRKEEVLLREASKEDELKQSSQFQNEDHVKVIVAHNFQIRIIDK